MLGGKLVNFDFEKLSKLFDFKELFINIKVVGTLIYGVDFLKIV